MNTSVENEILTDVPDQIEAQEGTTLGQLGQAIRRSTILFIIATVALVIAFVVITNRETALQNIFTQVESANKVEVDALSIREAEKDFRLTFNQDDLSTIKAKYADAEKQIQTMLSSPGATANELDTIKQIEANLRTYNSTLGTALASLQQRGFSAESGTRKTLRQAGISLTKAVNGANSTQITYAAEMVRSKMKDFIILEREEFIQPINRAVSAFRSAVSSDENLTSNEKDNLTKFVNEYSTGAEAYIKYTLDAKTSFEKATTDFDKTLQPLPALINELNQREESAFQQIFIVLIIAAIVMLLIFVLIYLQLRNAQTGANKTLQETVDAQQAAEEENERLNDSVINILQAVSSLSERDLTARAPVTEDVIGTVSDSINLLADETSVVLKDVTNIAGQVSLVSDTVHSQAEQVSQTAEEERKNVQNMIETLFDATQTMNQVAALAEQSNESAAQATEVTENALATVNQTVGGMESIRETISETEKRIKRLGERSQEISGIVNLINTISERTHVLALNASMQAAVAGEAGRGFAVVAEEVQQLAESSRNATEQIATLVNNIQIETNETINTVNRTIGQVVEGSEQAQQAGEQMRRTQEITAELVGRVQNIALASQQQKDMSADLLEAVQAIGDSTEKTAAQIDAQNAGTEELQKAAKQLVDSVNVFKLPA